MVVPGRPKRVLELGAEEGHSLRAPEDEGVLDDLQEAERRRRRRHR